MRIREVAKWYSPKLQFAFKDRSGRKVSEVQRIAKRYLEIEPFIVELKDDFGHKFLCASNIIWNSPYVNPHTPPGTLDPDKLREIVAGVPRRYPCSMAFVFDELTWGHRTGPTEAERMVNGYLGEAFGS